MVLQFATVTAALVELLVTKNAPTMENVSMGLVTVDLKDGGVQHVTLKGVLDGVRIVQDMEVVFHPRDSVFADLVGVEEDVKLHNVQVAETVAIMVSVMG